MTTNTTEKGLETHIAQYLVSEEGLLIKIGSRSCTKYELNDE